MTSIYHIDDYPRIRQHRILLKYMILFLLLFTILSPLNAQQKRHKHIGSNMMIEGRIGYGFLIPHRLEMEIFNAHFPTIEISLARLTDGRNRWEYMYGYPIAGIAYWYSTLGPAGPLGDAHAIYPYINFPLTRNGKTRLFFRGGVGLGYLTKHFDRLENYKNIAIGSSINAAVSMAFQVRTRIMNRLFLSGSISLNHFSNGSMKTPNYGINILAVNAGAIYLLSKENPYMKSKLMPELYPYEFDGKKFFQIQVGAGVGYKNMEAELGGSYGVLALYTNLLKQVSFKSRLGVGFDVSYDGTDVVLIEQGTGEELESIIPAIKTGGTFAWEFMISKVSLVFNLGGYFSGKYKSEGGIYEKLAIWYYFNSNVFTSLTLKAHYARADYITFGLGYNFNIKYY